MLDGGQNNKGSVDTKNSKEKEEKKEKETY